MSDTDSFIEEVTEEVRRDRLFLMLKDLKTRYLTDEQVRALQDKFPS